MPEIRSVGQAERMIYRRSVARRSMPAGTRIVFPLKNTRCEFADATICGWPVYYSKRKWRTLNAPASWHLKRDCGWKVKKTRDETRQGTDSILCIQDGAEAPYPCLTQRPTLSSIPIRSRLSFRGKLIVMSFHNVLKQKSFKQVADETVKFFFCSIQDRRAVTLLPDRWVSINSILGYALNSFFIVRLDRLSDRERTGCA